jgi:hypothetical protein
VGETLHVSVRPQFWDPHTRRWAPLLEDFLSVELLLAAERVASVGAQHVHESRRDVGWLALSSCGCAPRSSLPSSSRVKGRNRALTPRGVERTGETVQHQTTLPTIHQPSGRRLQHRNSDTKRLQVRESSVASRVVSGDDSLSLCNSLHGSEEAAAPLSLSLSLFLSADEGDGAGARSSHEPPGGRGSLGQLEAAAAGGHVHGARAARSPRPQPPAHHHPPARAATRYAAVGPVEPPAPTRRRRLLRAGGATGAGHARGSGQRGAWKEMIQVSRIAVWGGHEASLGRWWVWLG